MYNFLNILETLALAETNAGKSSFATGTSAIAAFLAIAEDCVFFRNWFHTFYFSLLLLDDQNLAISRYWCVIVYDIHFDWGFVLTPIPL